MPEIDLMFRCNKIMAVMIKKLCEPLRKPRPEAKMRDTVVPQPDPHASVFEIALPWGATTHQTY